MDPSPLNILLIEDNPGDARLIQEMLREANPSSFTLHWVDRLAAGLASLREQTPAIVLLDLSLPDSFGLATFDAVNRQAADVPVVVLTGLNDEASAISALQHGAQDYLVKGQIDGPFLGRALRYAIERQRIERENVQLYRQAQEALRLRDLVLSSVSHDLRAPLTAVKVIAGTVKWQLEQHPMASAETVRAAIDGLGRIDLNTDRMTSQIEELLDVARLQVGGQIRLSRRSVDLVALLQALVQEHQERTRRHQIRFETSRPRVTGAWDSARLERVFANLLSNAVKYSPDGGEICVNLDVEDDGAWADVQVRDQGAGIPAGELDRVFTWFFRGTNVAESVTGSGLGLAGARRIVDLHGGSISVESTEGAGSTFTVRLPTTYEPSEDPEA